MGKLRRIIDEIVKGVGEGFILAGMIGLLNVLDIKSLWAVLIVVGIAIIAAVVERQTERKGG